MAGLPRLWRFLLLLSLAISCGGFTFYAAVVVPIGTDVLDATSQGFVTREVTATLNILSAITVLLLAGDLIGSRPARTRTGHRAALLLTVFSAVAVAVLFALHPALDRHLHPADFAVENSAGFYRLHRVYLWVSTLHWAASLGLLWILSDVPSPIREYDSTSMTSPDSVSRETE